MGIFLYLVFLSAVSDYFRTLVDPMLDSLSVLHERFGEFKEGASSSTDAWTLLHSLVGAALRTAHTTALCVVHGRTTSNTAPDIEFGESEYNFIQSLRQYPLGKPNIDISLIIPSCLRMFHRLS